MWKIVHEPAARCRRQRLSTAGHFDRIKVVVSGTWAWCWPGISTPQVGYTQWSLSIYTDYSSSEIFSIFLYVCVRVFVHSSHRSTYSYSEFDMINWSVSPEVHDTFTKFQKNLHQQTAQDVYKCPDAFVCKPFARGRHNNNSWKRRLDETS